ncbi:MAG: alpha/beta hydrolase [Bdellovibrionota bacterium]
MKLALTALAIFPMTMAIAATEPTKDMKQVLDALKAQDTKPIETLTPEQARSQKGPSDAAKAVITKKEGAFKPLEISRIEERQIDGAAGKIGARIYTPEGKTPLPVIVYYHGGGFVIATNDTYDASARALAKNANAIVVAVEYRKAPEHKFPAAHDDAFAAYRWVLSNAQNLGGDPQRIAVAGESAGGNLALNTAIRARDEGLSIPTHELLIYPVASTTMDTASYKEHANAQPLNKKGMTWFVENYTNGTTDLKDKRLNLVEADFKGLAPATIITADIDPLRDEGKLLAEKMRGQGVTVEYRNYEGVTHEFFGMAPLLQEAAAAQNFAITDLKESFEKQAQEEKVE